MSTRSSRKRRRSQAFPDAEELGDTIDDDEPPKCVQSTGQDRLDKEREVWDAFKDEHVEVFDLSSSLWRRFDLVRELDQQDTKNTSLLLDSFMEYVQRRRIIAQPPPIIAAPVFESEPETSEETLSIQAENAFSMKGAPRVQSESSSARRSEPPTDCASSPPLKHTPAVPSNHSSRELLTIIAKFSEASIRDREEKVNLTRAACDSVERSIRLIDQAIQEQEHAISLGTRPGTHLAPVLLPEIVMPKSNKPVRVSISPDLEDAFGGAEPKPPTQSRRKKNRRGRKKETLPVEAVVPLPRPKPPIIPNADPNESRYCYCDQVSFGEVRASLAFLSSALTSWKMIGCDDARCEREWFHLSCTNLKTAPEGRKKWYCDDCTLRRNRKRAR
ncbi:hypothetical protein B0H15DRAFT_115152 [Mycena belliarum]|uniref:Zinc finger PHD-type domain-containing protein n=1 Tax=Mycena belliarum TaxID=1033014 RepID=A0AAD6TRK2_9AGAR|nr:hypothetical protein B0H15DRAFT_115152 [Mycena belliae]